MKIRDFEDCLFWWLEEIPLDEFSSEETREIVKLFRNGTYDVLTASEYLETCCREEITTWMQTNRAYKQLFS
jgi:hypothetical protein